MFSNVGMGPFIWKTPSNVLITGLEGLSLMRSLKLENDPYIWKSSEGHKWPPDPFYEKKTHIGGRHFGLYFTIHIQVTETLYKAAMC